MSASGVSSLGSFGSRPSARISEPSLCPPLSESASSGSVMKLLPQSSAPSERKSKSVSGSLGSVPRKSSYTSASPSPSLSVSSSLGFSGSLPRSRYSRPSPRARHCSAGPPPSLFGFNGSVPISTSSPSSRRSSSLSGSSGSVPRSSSSSLLSPSSSLSEPSSSGSRGLVFILMTSVPSSLPPPSVSGTAGSVPIRAS